MDPRYTQYPQPPNGTPGAQAYGQPGYAPQGQPHYGQHPQYINQHVSMSLTQHNLFMQYLYLFSAFLYRDIQRLILLNPDITQILAHIRLSSILHNMVKYTPHQPKLLNLLPQRLSALNRLWKFNGFHQQTISPLWINGLQTWTLSTKVLLEDWRLLNSYRSQTFPRIRYAPYGLSLITRTSAM